MLAAELNQLGVAEMQFYGDLVFSTEPHWRTLDFTLSAADVGKLYTIYAQPIALDTAFSGLETAGDARVNIGGVDNEIDNCDLHFDQIYIDDDERRFHFMGWMATSYCTAARNSMNHTLIRLPPNGT